MWAEVILFLLWSGSAHYPQDYPSKAAVTSVFTVTKKSLTVVFSSSLFLQISGKDKVIDRDESNQKMIYDRPARCLISCSIELQQYNQSTKTNPAMVQVLCVALTQLVFKWDPFNPHMFLGILGNHIR